MNSPTTTRRNRSSSCATERSSAPSSSSPSPSRDSSVRNSRRRSRSSRSSSWTRSGSTRRNMCSAKCTLSRWRQPELCLSPRWRSGSNPWRARHARVAQSHNAHGERAAKAHFGGLSYRARRVQMPAPMPALQVARSRPSPVRRAAYLGLAAFLLLNVLAFAAAFALTHFTKVAGRRARWPRAVQAASWLERLRPEDVAESPRFGMRADTHVFTGARRARPPGLVRSPHPSRRGLVLMFHGYRDRKTNLVAGGARLPRPGILRSPRRLLRLGRIGGQRHLDRLSRGGRRGARARVRADPPGRAKVRPLRNLDGRRGRSSAR